MNSDSANLEAKSKPHYLQENFTTKLSSYANDEQDRIRWAFQPCGFTSIHSLPFPAVGSGGVQEGIELPPFRMGRPSPLFTNFVYLSEPYGLADELKILERKQQAELQQNIAGETPFVPASDRFSAKYEGMYKYVPEPADAVRDVQMRQKWLTEKKILGVPFLPPGGQKSLEKPTRALLTDALTQLYRLLCNDWEEAQPTVFTTEEDIIVIYFSLAHIANVAGIVAYMNVLATRNDIISKYDLQKVTQGWGMRTEDNHLMFALQPPWVRGKTYIAATSPSELL